MTFAALVAILILGPLVLANKVPLQCSEPMSLSHAWLWCFLLHFYTAVAMVDIVILLILMELPLWLW